MLIKYQWRKYDVMQKYLKYWKQSTCNGFVPNGTFMPNVWSYGMYNMVEIYAHIYNSRR